MGAGPMAVIAAWLGTALPGAPVEPAPAASCVAAPGMRTAADAGACWSAGHGVLVRRDRRGTAEARPLAVLRGAAVDAIAAHDGTVWLGLSAAGSDRAPLGLVRYDWTRDRAHAFRGTDSGPCGFFVHDLLVHEQTLWVATDLGVSRLGLSPDTWDEWAHFAPGPPLEETACATLLAKATEPRWLAEFRPRYWKRHSQRRR